MILVTNDDGVYSPGIQLLAKHLRELDSAVIVAPDRERSVCARIAEKYWQYTANRL
jgi:5'/3'-nucleotidase SurE